MAGSTNPLPRWRGFNLLYFFHTRSDCQPLAEDFQWLADWGFNFVRLPMCYLLWVEPDDIYRVRPAILERVDAAVELGRHHGIHVNLSFHRAPGYSVNGERTEPFNLWKEQAALDAFLFHWRLFAERYRDIPSAQLSFNLVNEPASPDPAQMTRDDHARVVRAATAAIHAADPQRLVIADGVSWGNDPCPELADAPVAQSCRAYLPMGVSHYQASWVGGEKFPVPAWPGGWHYGTAWDRPRLEEHYAQWRALTARGVGVHCGEGGAFNRTPHDIVLRWFRDVLEILTAADIGYALWNFRGSFGILDSGRDDVAGVDWHGHRLDRKLLELLQGF
jgi:endoglucanase